MKKIWKYIVGFFTLVGGILIAFLSGKSAGRKDEKFKGLKKESKSLEKMIKQKEKKQKDVKKNIESAKKQLTKLKQEKSKKVASDKVSAKQAADFLKKYSKGKKNA